MLAQNIAALISLSIGLYCTWIGFRGVPVEWQQWQAKWGTLLKIAGPAMIATGLFTLVV